MKKYLLFSGLFFGMLFLLPIPSHAQWQPDFRLTNNPAESHTSFHNTWSVAANGNIVHVVWYDTRDGNTNYELYYKRSTDGGISWGTDTRLTNNSAWSFNPSISVSGSVVHVVWYDLRDGNYEIYYKRSTDAGASWGTDTRLTNNPAFSGFPSGSVSGQLLVIVWHENRDGNYEIYYRRSTNAGLNWGAETRLTNKSAFSGYPSISISGSVVHVVWQDECNGNPEIYYKRSPDGGLSWEERRLTNNSDSSGVPSISVSGQVVHVVWSDWRDGNKEIYYKRSTDSGTEWTEDMRLTNNFAESRSPSVSVSGSIVHLIWLDNRNGNYEIYYKCSNDGGKIWGAETRLTNKSADSWYPSGAVSGSVVHVVWRDIRDGNYEIYYKRNPIGNAATSIKSADSINKKIPSDKWVIKKLSAKSNTGKLYVTLPKGAAWDMTIYAAGSSKVLSNTILKTSFNLLPGVYDLEINKIKITGVPVEKGNETRLKTGVLHISNPTSWTLYDAAKQTVLINSLAADTRGLPVGKYKLTIMGQDTDIEIKDGETVSF